MASNNNLAIASHTILVKGGYGRYGNTTIFDCPPGSDCFSGNCDWVEAINGSCAPIDPGGGFTPAPDEGEEIREYTWRDSNINDPQPGGGGYGGKNSNSGEAYVTLKDVWTSTVDGSNNLTVTTKTYLIEHGRRDIRTNLRTPGRDVKIYGFDQGSKSWVEKWSKDAEAVNEHAVYYSGNMLLATNTFVLPPQTSSADINYTVRVWNKTAGAQFGYYEPYLDEMQMGLQFKNNLPNELEPPRLSHVAQQVDICENWVDMDLTFTGPNLDAVLVFDWKYQDENDYPASNHIEIDAVRGAAVTVRLGQLIPTGYTQSAIDWKAQYKPRPGSNLHASDWTYGSQIVEFNPPYDMTVPDISDAECAAIGRGEYLEQFDHIVYYDEENKI